MHKQTELPELPEPKYEGGVYHQVAIQPAYTASQMREYGVHCYEAGVFAALRVLEENERLRKELAAVKGEGEAVAWRVFRSGRWCFAYSPDRCLCDSDDWEPLYLHPRAEPSDREMLEWAIKEGWLSLPNAERTVWSTLTDEQEVSHFLDAIRAAMKAQS